jgi:hypothetical protein
LVEVTGARDVTFSGDTATGDASTRSGGSFRQLIATLSDAEVEFEMIYNTSDGAFTFFRAAWIAKTSFGVAVLDGDSATTGTEGLWMDAMVTGFEWAQELEEPGKVTITLANTYSTVALEAVDVVATPP